MGKTPTGTVRDTGAKPGQILIGIAEQPLNRGLRIKVHRSQAKGSGGRITGSFEVLDAGTGKYAHYLNEYVGEPFMEADHLIDSIQKQGGGAVDCTHILNRNKLRVDDFQS
jgi:hypothetical protein